MEPAGYLSNTNSSFAWHRGAVFGAQLRGQKLLLEVHVLDDKLFEKSLYPLSCGAKNAPVCPGDKALNTTLCGWVGLHVQENIRSMHRKKTTVWCAWLRRHRWSGAL